MCCSHGAVHFQQEHEYKLVDTTQAFTQTEDYLFVLSRADMRDSSLRIHEELVKANLIIL